MYFCIFKYQKKNKSNDLIKIKSNKYIRLKYNNLIIEDNKLWNYTIEIYRFYLPALTKCGVKARCGPALRRTSKG